MSFYRCLLLLFCFVFMASCSTTRTIKEADSLSVKQLSERGIIQLKNGNYEKARQFFASALKMDPKYCHLHFLNALTYHLQGRTGNYRLLDLAESGYRNAIKFCPRDPWPYYYLGLIDLYKKNYKQSEMMFYQAMKYGKGQGNIPFLKGFIQSAQKAGDYRAIDQLISQLRKLDPKSPLIKELSEIRNSIPRHQTSSTMRKQTDKYSKLSKSQSYDSKASVVKHDRKQVFIDAILIVSREAQTRNRGVNLLNGLQLQYGNSVAVNKFTTSNFAKYGNAASQAGFDRLSATLPDLDYSTLVTHAISIPDVNYNLNIFNDINEHDEILSRPTLLARDGKVSTYFSGNRLIVGVSGLNTGQIESIPIGLTLKVKPTFKDDGSMDLDIDFGKEQIIISSFTASGSNIDSVATTLKQDTKTSVNVHFGETIILSALSEGISSREDNRTPGLGDLPLIRYFFGHKLDQVRNISIIVLMTPHKEISFEGDSDNTEEVKNAKDFYNRFPEPVSNLNEVLTGLSKGRIYSVFTTFHTDFYSKEILDKAVNYTSNNIDEF